MDSNKKTLTIDDTVLNLKPMNFATLEAIQPNLGLLMSLAGATGVPDLATLKAVTETVHIALVKANPDLTLDQVKELLTIENCGLVIEQIFMSSGVKTSGKV